MKNILFLLGFFFTSLHSFQAPAPNWVQPLGQDSAVIFFQGAGLSQVEAATYMAGSSFVSPTTQEKISSTTGILIFKNVCVDPELPEVILANRRPVDLVEKCLHPVKYHFEQKVRKSYQQAGIQVAAQMNASDEYTLAAHTIDRSKVTLGQMPDIQMHQERAQNFKTRFGNMPQIWHGTSRGAEVTAISAALAAKSNPALLQTVKLLLLEGCYGSVESDMHCITNSQIAINCANAAFSWWYSYKPGGINLFQVLKDFPRTIPTVFITSRADEQVPKTETDKLVSELVNAGYDNIYYLILDKAGHGNYVSGNRADALKYQAFIHALYKQLYLPYIPSYAAEGQSLLTISKKNAEAFKKQPLS